MGINLQMDDQQWERPKGLKPDKGEKPISKILLVKQLPVQVIVHGPCAILQCTGNFKLCYVHQ